MLLFKREMDPHLDSHRDLNGVELLEADVARVVLVGELEGVFDVQQVLDVEGLAVVLPVRIRTD